MDHITKKYDNVNIQDKSEKTFHEKHDSHITKQCKQFK